MPKQTSYSFQAGQMEGAILKIEAVHNDGLQESVTIFNRGTVTQLMSGWVLVSLRGQIFYPFPENFMLRAKMGVVIHSGKTESEKVTNLHVDRVIDLWWTAAQVWNDHWDTAMLFDAKGLEIDRHTYPHDRVRGSSANGPKVLVWCEPSFEFTDESLIWAKKLLVNRTGR